MQVEPRQAPQEAAPQQHPPQPPQEGEANDRQADEPVPQSREGARDGRTLGAERRTAAVQVQVRTGEQHRERAEKTEQLRPPGAREPPRARQVGTQRRLRPRGHDLRAHHRLDEGGHARCDQGFGHEEKRQRHQETNMHADRRKREERIVDAVDPAEQQQHQPERAAEHQSERHRIRVAADQTEPATEALQRPSSEHERVGGCARRGCSA